MSQLDDVAAVLTEAFPHATTIDLMAPAVSDALDSLGLTVGPADSFTPLPDVASSRGPKTSDMAAASVDEMSWRHWSVLMALKECGPATDQELCDRYPGLVAAQQHGFAAQSDASIRTRRAELTKAGHVEFTGLYRPTRSGRQAMVWASR